MTDIKPKQKKEYVFLVKDTYQTEHAYFVAKTKVIANKIVKCLAEEGYSVEIEKMEVITK